MATVLAAVPEVAFAQSPTVDWKLYGEASVVEEAVCFYEAGSVTQGSAANIRVWTKCLRQKDLDRIEVKSGAGKKIVENTARKVANHYVPPIALVEHFDADQRLTFTRYEVAADAGTIDPLASILYELNCRDRMMRELSISIHAGGKSGSLKSPTEWEYVPPEGNGARLQKMLCDAR